MQKKYPLSMRVLHWLMALLLVMLVAVGLWMVGMPSTSAKYEIFALHKSFGMLALILVIIRLAVRFKSDIPKLPNKINRRDALLSSITIFILYIGMILQPLSGYLASSFGGYKVAFFTLNVPLLLGKNPSLAYLFNEVHIILGYGIIAIVLLHVLGSIKHLLVEKINLFRRIW